MRRLAYRGHAVSRDENELAIVRALEAVGATVQRLDVPCDLLVGFRGKNFLLEVKRPKEKLTLTQELFGKTWRGTPVAIVRSEREALQAIGAVK